MVDTNDKVVGLLGYPLSHSFSKRYFTDKFAASENLRHWSFRNFEIPELNDQTLQNALLQTPSLQGFCITIPHKKNILPWLHHTNDAVQAIGACNCVRLIDGQLWGYNTDYIGFRQSFEPLLQHHHQQALVLGTGGAAAAIMYALRQMNIRYTAVSRTATQATITYDAITPEVLAAHPIVINTTPLGTYPNVHEAPPLPYEVLTTQHYLFDVVYNPNLTQFLAWGKQAGATIKNGYDMLVLQAEENWRIWQSVPA
ncbi:MAG: shikimate dehydrogenase family protein [Chitinophagaceae bacterium]